MDIINKYLRYAIVILLVLLSILKAMDICLDHTFSAWFANTEASSLMKNPKVTSGKLNIEIDVYIIGHINTDKQGGSCVDISI